MSKTKVYWTGPEEDQIAAYLFEAGLTSKSRDVVRVSREAQDKLFPAERRRVIKSRLNIPEQVLRKVDAIQRKQMKELAEAKEPKPPQRAEPLVEVRPAAPQGVLERFVGAFETIANAAATAAEVLWITRGQKFVEDPLVSAEPESVTPQQRDRKLKVLICGANADQHQSVERAHGERVRVTSLNHWSPRLADCVAGADVIIGMTRFMNHQMEHVIKANRDKDRTPYFRVNGGATDVNNTLALHLNGAH